MTGAPVLRYFETDHLAEPLRTISEPFRRLARQLDESLPTGPELSTALRKLLEAKDAAVRAALDIDKHDTAPEPVGEQIAVTAPDSTRPVGAAVTERVVLPAGTPQPG